jgi:hypothetical protein
MLLERDDTPALRTRSTPVPCETDTGCPKGTWSAPNCTEQVITAYHHYKQCQAINRFPDDSLVEQHAGIIRMQEDRHKEQQDAERWKRLTDLMTLRGAYG